MCLFVNVKVQYIYNIEEIKAYTVHPYKITPITFKQITFSQDEQSPNKYKMIPVVDISYKTLDHSLRKVVAIKAFLTPFPYCFIDLYKQLVLLKTVHYHHLKIIGRHLEIPKWLSSHLNSFSQTQHIKIITYGVFLLATLSFEYNVV